MRVRLDEETLKTIANITHGEYFYAGTAADLKKVYQSLNPVREGEETERATIFAATAALRVLLSASLSLLVQPDSVAPPYSASPAQSFPRCPRSMAFKRCSLINSRRWEGNALFPRRGEGELHVLQPKLHRELRGLVGALHHQLAVVLVGRRSERGARQDSEKHLGRDTASRIRKKLRRGSR